EIAPQPETSAAPAANAALRLPAGIAIKLRLDASIDTATAAAGDPVTAHVAEAVRDPKIGGVILPAGGVVRGRITRMEHWLTPRKWFVIAVHWESIAQDGRTAPFSPVFPERPARFACEGEFVAPLQAVTSTGAAGGIIRPG